MLLSRPRDFTLPVLQRPDCRMERHTGADMCEPVGWRLHTACDVKVISRQGPDVDHWLLGYEHMWHGGFYTNSPCAKEPEGYLTR